MRLSPKQSQFKFQRTVFILPLPIIIYLGVLWVISTGIDSDKIIMRVDGVAKKLHCLILASVISGLAGPEWSSFDHCACRDQVRHWACPPDLAGTLGRLAVRFSALIALTDSGRSELIHRTVLPA